MGSEISGFISWDRAMFVAVNKSMSNGFLDALLPLFSDFRLWVVPLAIVWLLFFLRADRRGRLVAIGCFIVVFATDQIADSVLKPAVQRVRPCNVVPAAHFYNSTGHWITTDKFALTTYKESWSFPSNHAANIAGQAVYWSFFYPQITPVMIFVAAGVGYSRIYLGHHYPGDVVAGYLLGVLLAVTIAFMLKRWIIPDQRQ